MSENSIWDSSESRIPRYRNFPEDENMEWWEEYIEHMKNLCLDEEITLNEFEHAIDIIHQSRGAGGPKEAATKLEKRFGISPSTFLLDSKADNAVRNSRKS